MDIHQAGGGIHFTVTHTKNASEEQLYETLKERLEGFSAAGMYCFITWLWNFFVGKIKCEFKKGTTFIECKSGYGLEWETELKMMRVLTRAKRELQSLGITNTYLGGHAVPR